ncbi:MAG TPA: MFS transporter [Anaerolineaceae bacterium]
MTAIASATRPSAFEVFQNRGFSLLWSGQLVSTTGSALTSLAAGILVFRLTHSALSVGLMLMATALPTLLVGLVAGVYVDRMDRKRIMIAADLTRAVLVFLIPFLIPHNINFLYLIVFLSSAVGRFFDPAMESVLPELATEEELASANSLMAISTFGSTAIGFAASGLIASALNINWAFYIDAATFVFSAACVWLIRVERIKVEGKTSVSAVFQNLRGGLGYLLQNRVLRALLIISVPVFISFGMWNSLLLPFALRALHASEFEYGLQEGLTSVGFVIASLLMASLTDRLREGQWVAISFLVMGIVGIFYGLAASVPYAILLVMISGFFNAPGSIVRRLLIQRNTRREVRGRITSAFFVTRDTVFLLGMGLAGLADLVDVRVVVIASSVILIGAGVGAALIPGLRLPAAQWRRTVSLLRAASLAPGLSPSRAALPADFDLLAGQFPGISSLRGQDWSSLSSRTLVCDAAPGAVILRQGDRSSDAYFILKGQAAAGKQEGGSYRVLEVLNAGDFFGEVAALTGSPRTANVVAQDASTLLVVPAAVLREMMADPQINRIFMTKMTERMMRVNMIDMPRYSSLSQGVLRELRTPESSAG